MIRRRILDLAVEIRVEEPSVERALSELLRAFPESHATRDVLRYDIRPTGEQFTIAIGSQCSPPTDADAIFALLQDDLIGRLGDRDQYTLLHAAVVEQDGEALLLPGASHRGKTSLAAALLDRGFRLLSDEVGALDDAGRAAACPFPLRFRESALRHLVPRPQGVDIGTSFFVNRGERTWYGLPAPDRPPPVTPCPVGMVVYPHLRPDPGTTLVPVSRGQAAFRLVAAMFNGHVVGMRGIDVAIHLARTTDCQVLRTNRLYAGAECIVAAWEKRRLSRT